MSSQIGEEVLLLCMSAYGGLILALCYDGMRIVRRVFKASIFRVVVEDIIFWTVASIFMFDIFLKYNYGRPRYYAIGAALGTMALFEWLIGRYLVDKISGLLGKILKTLLKPLKKAIKAIKLNLGKWKILIRKKVKKCQKTETPDIHKTIREEKQQMAHHTRKET